MEHRLFIDIMYILGISLVTVLVCHRFRIPTIVGFILAGIEVGPHGTGLVHSVSEVEILSEIGVILLLFTIGIEFSLQNLLKIKKLLLIGGIIQAVLTFAVGTAAAIAAGMPPDQSIFIGCIITLSSTAIVLRLLQKRGEIDTPHGRSALGILIFQDLLVIPMMMAVPLLAGGGSVTKGEVIPLLFKATALVVFVIVCARWLLPRLLHHIGRSRDPELFLVSVVFIGFGIAFVTYSIGLSLALGAFLAGLMLSSSQYGRRALGSLLPLRDLFLSFFFVSIGMLLDLSVIAEQPGIVFGGTALLIITKAITAAMAAIVLGLPLRAAIMCGLILAQVGEFSFILATAGTKAGLLLPSHYQTVLAVAVVSMTCSPFLIAGAGRCADVVMRIPFPRRLKSGVFPGEGEPRLTDHLIIIGFGLGGRNVADAADVASIPYIIIEANPDTVRTERAAGRKIYHGDASSESLLEHAGIEQARVAVITISDPAGTHRIVDVIRHLNQRTHIIVRTRYFNDIPSLQKLGANEVVAEEYESSIEIFTRVLQKYLVQRREIDAFIGRVRSQGYEMLRTPSEHLGAKIDLNMVLSETDVRSIVVEGRSGADGRSLGELDLRKNYGITVLSIIRKGGIVTLPDAEERFVPGDEVVLLGLPDLLVFADGIFKRPVHEEDM